MNKQLSAFESFWYILFNILTLGLVYLYKIIIKKAILETQWE